RRRRGEGRQAARPGARVRERPHGRSLRGRAQDRGIRSTVVRAFPVLLALALAAALTFLTLPVVAIFVDSSPGELIDSLGEPGALDALWLSLRATAMAVAIILV